MVAQLKKSFFENLWEKSTWNSFFAIEIHIILVHKWHITHLWCIKQHIGKFYGFVLSQDTFWILKTIFLKFMNFWPIWGLLGVTRNFTKSKKNVSYFSNIYVYIQMSSERFIFIETLKMGIIYTLHIFLQKC